jgi:transcriptional regulator with XRE-family HTH domain
MPTKLKELRDERQWTQPRLIIELENCARRHGVNIAERSSLKVMVSRWENGRGGAMDERYRALFREVYRTTDEGLGLPPTDQSSPPIPSTLGFSRAPSSGPETITWLAGVFEQHVQAEPFIGPQLLLPSVQPQLEIINTLCKRSSGQIRNEAYAIGAQFAEFCGWLYQDAGDSKSAAYWTGEAQDFAQMRGDELMISYALMRKANIAVEDNNPGHSIGLADAALRVNTPLPPRMRAAALRVKANGAAILGDRTEFQRAIEEASELAELGARDADLDDPARYCTPSYVQMEEATCLVRLGEPEAALAIFEHGLKAWPMAQRRDRGLCLARMATAHAVNRDVDQALAVASEASAIAWETGSVRITRELERLRTQVAQQAGSGVISDLERAITRP